jgi:hypothetical protein
MRKSIDLGLHDQDGWPNPKELEGYFLGAQGYDWLPDDPSDSAALWAKGVHGTEHLDVGKGRIDIELLIWRNPDFGVLLIYSKWGGPYEEMFSSKGDLSRLHDFVRALHGTLLPIGLFVPFGTAWKAVKEFIETDGELPKSIEWIANRDLPPGTFPKPHEY